MPELVTSIEDEQRLRTLATEIAKDIEDPKTLRERLGFSAEDYIELCETRTFKTMLDQAISEWHGASNTHKRVRLKAAVNIENSMPAMYKAMVDQTEPLSSRVKAFEIMARVGGLGNPDPVMPGVGSAFQLTIHLNGGAAPLVIGGEYTTLGETGAEDTEPTYSQSNLLDDIPLEEL
jgi:hypothetical protein